MTGQKWSNMGVTRFGNGGAGTDQPRPEYYPIRCPFDENTVSHRELPTGNQRRGEQRPRTCVLLGTVGAQRYRGDHRTQLPP